jgi:transcription antitermination factor NusG
LVEKGYEVFLPTVHKWSRNKRVQRLYRAPLFPGYLFVRHAIDRFSYLDISKARGLVQILGDRWDRLAAVEDREIEALMKLQEADIPRMPYSYLREGEPVRIISGPLTNVEGIFVKPDSERGLLVLSVALLSRSVAVHVERSQVVPV